MTRSAFLLLMERLAGAWNSGDAAAAAACFADAVDYADPVLYRFTRRHELLPFFEPGPEGHHVRWHRLLFDETQQTGVVEYTYRGHHRYHGAAVVKVDAAGLIARWREWQHRSDNRDWSAFLAEDA
jgi:hypothetical protein